MPFEPFEVASEKPRGPMPLETTIEKVSHLTGLSILDLKSQLEPASRLADTCFIVENVTDEAQLKAMGFASLVKIKNEQINPQFYIWLYKEEGSDQVGVKEVLPIRNHSALSALARVKLFAKNSKKVIGEDVLRFLEEFDGYLTVEDRGDYVKLIGLKDGDLRIRIILKPLEV